jgi:hypothetical protein
MGKVSKTSIGLGGKNRFHLQRLHVEQIEPVGPVR